MHSEFKKAYTQQKSNAKRRGVCFELTFTEWLAVWMWSDKLSERGRGADRYCMARINDTGPYSATNVYITVNAKNVSDGNVGKIDSLSTRLKKSLANAGRPKDWARGERNPMHRADVKAKISAAISGAKHYNARGVVTPSGRFETARSAALALGMSKSTVEWRAKNEKFGFAYAA
jgi:hypothetical protein